MSSFFNLNTEANYLEITAGGVVGRITGIELAKELVKYASDHPYGRCLIDYRAVELITYSTIEIYDLPKFHTEMGLPRSLKIGLVVPMRFSKEFYFFETVARNSGFWISIFFDYSEAQKWALAGKY